MSLDGLKKIWKEEENHILKGWDFSHIKNRKKDESLPWDYKKIVEGYMSCNKVMLDMGTGGGEFLLSLNPPSGRTYATESYLPNVQISKKALSPLGIEVKAFEDDSELPFEDNCFDLIINRHESYCLTEVNRILKPGGIFVTQQVGETNNKELSEFLLDKSYIKDCLPENLSEAVKEARGLGWKVIRQEEHFPKAYFYDIGALVFFAKGTIWDFPGFSVEECFERLLLLHEKVEKQGYIEAVEHRYLLIAQK